MQFKKNVQWAIDLARGELEETLKDVYEKQRLSKNQSKIARGIEILVGVLIMFSGIEWWYVLLYFLSVVYAIYRFLKPHEERENIYKDLSIVSECIDNYKKYKRNEVSIGLELSKIEGIEKNIQNFLPFLLKTSTFLRVLAFVPVFNLMVDEMYQYTHHNGALYCLLHGNLLRKGLSEFSNENIG